MTSRHGPVLRRFTVVLLAVTLVGAAMVVPARSAGAVLPNATAVAAAGSSGDGYWMLGADGEVYPFGDARDHGDALGRTTAMGFAALLPTPTGEGYWILTGFGSLWSYGDAADLDYPSAQRRTGERFTTGAVTPTGRGVWAFTDSGRVVTVGDAVDFGDMDGVALDGPVVASAVTPTGQGYYMIASDGGVFTFGDAVFRGSVRGALGGRFPDAPVVGVVPSPDNRGYWLVGADGGAFAFGAPFRGSIPGVLGPGVSLVAPVNGMVAYGNGYLMVASDGGIFNFSDRDFLGSLGGQNLPAPIIGVAPVPGGSTVQVMGRSGGTLGLAGGRPGEVGVSLSIPASALSTEVSVSLGATPQSAATTAELLSEPRSVVALQDYVESATVGGLAHPQISPLYLITQGRPGRYRYEMGPSGTSLASPATLRVPLANLGAESDETIIALLRSDDGRWESVPVAVDGDVVEVSIPHFSVLDIIRIPVRAGLSAVGNIWRNSAIFTDRVATLRQGRGKLSSGFDPALRAIREAACRDDLTFDPTQIPSLFRLAADLGAAGRTGATFGSSDIDALIGMVESRYDPATRDAVAGRRVGLAEILGEALDRTHGDIWQALFLTHETLKAARDRARFQLSMEQSIFDTSLGNRSTKTTRQLMDALSLPDERGGRYHLMGMALYSFAWMWMRESGSWSRASVPPEVAAFFEELVVSGDIATEPEEFVVDLEGSDLGKELWWLYQSAVGQGNPDTYEAICGSRPPGRLNVMLFGVPPDAEEGEVIDVRVEVRGGWVPAGPDRDYTVDLTAGSANSTSLLVPYRGGGDSDVWTTITFPNAGVHTVRVVARDAAGATDEDSVSLRIFEPPPPECREPGPCPDGPPITAVKSTGDWAIYRVTSIGWNTPGLCGVGHDETTPYTISHWETFAIVTDSWLQGALDYEAETRPNIGKWKRFVCEWGSVRSYEVEVIERHVSEEWAKERFAQMAVRLEARGYTETFSRFFPGPWTIWFPDDGSTGTIAVKTIWDNMIL
ncbi:MAG TPA: hypothetical protein ENI86_07905 [Acidimicrobiales bacterium]|nr:hypothetical protein [Acidimicrobiales bacterium]